MNISSSTFRYTSSYANIDRGTSSAKLTLTKRASDTGVSSSYPDKDTFTCSDGAKIHIADNIAGPNGVGNGNTYSRITDFLTQSLEQSLGSEVKEISIDDLEVYSQQLSLKTKQATPREYVGESDSIAYHMQKSKVNVDLNEITVEGTVKTSSGEEMQFSLDIDTYSEAGSTKQINSFGTKDAIKQSQMLMFDGVYRDFTDTSFSYDSNQDTKGSCSGYGSYCTQSTTHETAGSGFRRFDCRV